MRILVAGSRSWTDELAVRAVLDTVTREALKAGDREIVIVHGACPKGVDAYADRWARHHRVCWPIRVERYEADWHIFGKRAGYLRNTRMVRDGADVCLAFIRDESKGATMCADLAEENSIRTVRYVPRPDGSTE